MVTNQSSLGDDLGGLGNWASETAEDVGQALGLVADDLIPGDAAETGGIAEHLTTLGGAFDRSGEGFKKVDTGGWHGQAADAAHDYISTAIPKWFTAADAFTAAGKAVADYQKVLAESQAKAARAKADLERAEQASEAARKAHNANVDSYNSAVSAASSGGPPPGSAPGTFTDPAAEDRAAAQHAIDEAKTAVADAGERAAAAVRAAAEHAPPKPGLLTQMKENLVDHMQMGGRAVGSVVGGAVESAQGMASMVRQVNPLDLYNLGHPAEMAEAMSTTAMGVVGAVQDPYAAVKTVVNVDGWRNDPYRAAGSMVPDALASLAGGAGVASRLGRGVGKLGDEAADLGKTAHRAPEPPAHQPPPQPPPHPTPRPSHPEPPTAPWEHPSPPRTEHPTAPAHADQHSPEPHTAERPVVPERAPDGPRADTPETTARDTTDHPGERSEQRSEQPSDDSAPQQDHDQAPETGQQAPDHEPRGETQHDLSEQDRQTYRDRVEGRTGVSFEENVARLRDEHPELAHLDDEKAMALRRYIGEDANTLNRVLREDDVFDRDYMSAETNVLRSALDETPRVDLAETPKAYRDIGLSDDELRQVLQRYEPKTIVEEPAFTSASKDIPPEQFHQHGPDRPHKVRFIIDEPRHARDCETTNPGEREVMWQNNNRFIVNRLAKDGDVMNIYMRDLGQGSHTP